MSTKICLEDIQPNSLFQRYIDEIIPEVVNLVLKEKEWTLIGETNCKGNKALVLENSKHNRIGAFIATELNREPFYLGPEDDDTDSTSILMSLAYYLEDNGCHTFVNILINAFEDSYLENNKPDKNSRRFTKEHSNYYKTINDSETGKSLFIEYPRVEIDRTTGYLL